jgi:hypothetical protein
MGYIIGYKVSCPSCHLDVTDAVVFVDHEMCTRCPGCGTAAPYPRGIHPKNLTIKSGRPQCDTCGLLADFGRPWSNSWQLRCTSCLLEETRRFLRLHVNASSTKDVHSMGLVALAVGLPLAVLTAVLVVLETAWFVLTGLVALPLLALAANYLLRGGTVAAGMAEDAERAHQLLDRLDDDTLDEVAKLAVIGLAPGGLWSQKHPGSLLAHPQYPARA